MEFRQSCMDNYIFGTGLKPDNDHVFEVIVALTLFFLLRTFLDNLFSVINSVPVRSRW